MKEVLFKAVSINGDWDKDQARFRMKRFEKRAVRNVYKPMNKSSEVELTGSNIHD